jgi:hypothetical protein
MLNRQDYKGMNVANDMLPLQRTSRVRVNHSPKRQSALQRNMNGTLFFLFIKFIYGWITRTLKWTRTQLFLNSVFREHRHVNAWNAFLKEKLHEANSGHGKGDRFKLPAFVARYKNELLAEYQKLTPIQKQGMIAKVQVACEAKALPARANPKAVNQAITAAFSRMDQEVWLSFLMLSMLTGNSQWMALCMKTGMEGFFIAVQGTVKDHTELKVFFTEKADKFVRIVLDIEPQCLALRLKSWVVSGISKHFTHLLLTH